MKSCYSLALEKIILYFYLERSVKVIIQTYRQKAERAGNKEHTDDGIFEDIPQEKVDTRCTIYHIKLLSKKKSSQQKKEILCHSQPTLQNDYGEIDLPLHLLLFEVLYQNCNIGYFILAYINKALLHIKLKYRDWNTQRLFWYNSLVESKIKELSEAATGVFYKKSCS